jgi:glycosyltransferase involved in cell wall biosynthesis
VFKDHRIAVVIPAYNEAAFITDVVKGLPGFVDHVIVVDDGSRDATVEVVAGLADPRVVLRRHQRNAGVGAAMRTGYRTALDLGADIVVKMDGDGQMDPAELSRLIDPLVEGVADYAKGNRFLRPGLDAMPGLRLVGNTLLTFLTKVASGYWHVFDPQNGYTAVSAGAVRVIDVEALAAGYFFENDMLVRLNVHRFVVVDVPMSARYPHEKSSLSVARVIFTFPGFLLRRLCYRVYQKYILRDFSPIALFLILGLLLFTWGFLFGAVVWWHSIARQRVATTGTVMLSVLPLLLGFQLLLQAIVLDIQQAPSPDQRRR